MNGLTRELNKERSKTRNYKVETGFNMAKTKFTRKAQKELLRHLQYGLSDTAIAEKMGVSRKTIYNWKKKITAGGVNEVFTGEIMMDLLKDMHRKNKTRYSVMEKLKEDMGSSLEAIKALQSDGMQYSMAVATIIKKSGLSKFEYLHEEIGMLEERVETAKMYIRMLLANIIDLKVGEQETYPEVHDMVLELFEEE